VEPLQLLVGAEQQVIMQAALDGMSGEDVEILLLKYVHGWNYTRISQQLGLEGHRVAHRLRRARERLRYQLRQRGLEAE
jgi:RNA polymerase sigma factor (sigma-70 family)